MILETVQERIFSRVDGDAALKVLLGGSNRIFKGQQGLQPQINSIRYSNVIDVPGSLQADNVQSDEQYYQFQIYSDRFNEVVKQMRALLDRYRLAATSDAAAPIGVLDWVGPDEFDEGLKCGKKEIRFRFFVIPKPLGPV